MLPPSYIASTTTGERARHFELYSRLISTSSVIEMVATEVPDEEHVALHLAFRDRPGTLSAITASLGEHGSEPYRRLNHARWCSLLHGFS